MRIIRNKWVLTFVGVLLLAALWYVVADSFKEEEKELRSQFREAVKQNFPEQTNQFSSTIGLFYFNKNSSRQEGVDLGRDAVVLVHGLDDPGKVWQNLSPALVEEGYNVWLMEYPNDQPVIESTRLFFEELKQLKQQKIDTIAIVAHSMGGLVSRELLTSPAIAYEAAAADGQVPRVKVLIMVGTPNHGSQLARFRVLAELRDYFTRFTNGQGTWLGFILDGAGEAKIDLLPDSRFLSELNSRPNPEKVKMSIIAGVSSPWSDSEISAILESVEQKIPSLGHDDFEAIKDYLVAMTNGLGDGLVTVESTRLEGVPHTIVSGTHLTMIRNLTENSPRVPPAVPVIIGQLSETYRGAR